MGLAAIITNKYSDKELLVIGMIDMPLRHCAEDIKLAVETIVNSFKFDYSKINGNNNFLIIQFYQNFNVTFKGVCCDEGSAYVRLFKQISEKNLNFLNKGDIQPRVDQIKKVVNMSMIKSMTDLNISGNTSSVL